MNKEQKQRLKILLESSSWATYKGIVNIDVSFSRLTNQYVMCLGDNEMISFNTFEEFANHLENLIEKYKLETLNIFN